MKKIIPVVLPFLTTLTFITLVSGFSASYGQLETPDSNVTDWRTYSNGGLGISFQYPSAWELKEKNRFDTGPNVTVSSSPARFYVMKLDGSGSQSLKSQGLLAFTKSLEEGMGRTIEKTDLSKYKVGGEQAASYLFTDSDLFTNYAGKVIVVGHNGQPYVLGFRDSTSTFDSPETQNLLNKIIGSFKFLN